MRQDATTGDMMYTRTRWIQRFQNFERALQRLRDALAQPLESLSELEQEGLIQRFEYTYELAWKLMKDYLEHGGTEIVPVTPRNVVKEAFAAKLIEDGSIWADMVEKRNLTSHIYNEETFRTVLDAVVRDYGPALEKLHAFLKPKAAP